MIDAFEAVRRGIEAFGAMPAPSPPSSARATRGVGGRIAREAGDTGWALASTIVAPHDPEDTWRLENLDTQAFAKMPVHRLLELLCDLSPDISRGLWDLLRMCNPGWQVKVYRPGTRTIDVAGQEQITAFIGTLKDLHGDFNIVVNRMFIAAFMRGAFFAEIVLDAAGRAPVDLVTPDPLSIRFERANDPQRGTIFRPFQYQGAQKVYLDHPTIKYIPVDPFPGNPYGRPMASPAIFSTMFLLAMLHDIRRVLQQQGYPRIDITIDMERLASTMPDDLEGDEDALTNWVNKAIDDVVQMYAQLKPDDAYVHTDIVSVNRPVGTVDASSLGGLPAIIQILEKMTVRALKTMPLLLGHADSVSEANANRQWEIYAAGVKALQHFCEVLLERMFGIVLQAQGMQGMVEFRFAELRTAELLRDAQVELMISKVAAFQYDQGWISQDEAALKGANKEQADEDEPRNTGTDPNEGMEGAGAVASAQPDPGSIRDIIKGKTHGRREHATNGHA